MGQHLAWMLRHVHQHIELLGRKPHFPAGDRDGMGVEINVEITKVDLGLQRRCCWAENAEALREFAPAVHPC